MTPQFTIQDGYLKELPTVEKPIWNPEVWDLRCDFDNAMEEYNEHEAKLRTYRVANPSEWDNVPMPIGEDGFEVIEKNMGARYIREDGNPERDNWLKFAIPAQAAKGQEERTFTLVDMGEAIAAAWANGVMGGTTCDEFTKEYLKSKLGITPKQ